MLHILMNLNLGWRGGVPDRGGVTVQKVIDVFVQRRVQFMDPGQAGADISTCARVELRSRCLGRSAMCRGTR